MNGTTIVTTTTKFLRVFNTESVTVGSSGGAVGNIDGEYDLSGFRCFRIIPTENADEGAVHSIPLSKSANIQLVIGNVSQTDEDNNSVLIRVRVRERADVVGSFFATRFRTYLSGGPLQLNIPGYVQIPEKSDIEVDGLREGSTEAVALTLQLLAFNEPGS